MIRIVQLSIFDCPSFRARCRVAGLLSNSEHESTRRVGGGQFHKFGAVAKLLATKFRGLARIKKARNEVFLNRTETYSFYQVRQYQGNLPG